MREIFWSIFLIFFLRIIIRVIISSCCKQSKYSCSIKFSFVYFLHLFLSFRKRNKPLFYWLSNVRKNAWNFSITTWKCWFKPWRTEYFCNNDAIIWKSTPIFFYTFLNECEKYTNAHIQHIHNYIRFSQLIACSCVFPMSCRVLIE